MIRLRPAGPTSRGRGAALRALAALLLWGCGDDPASPLARSPFPTSTWLGSVTVTAPAPADPDQGTAVLDLVRGSGDQLQGTIVIRWPSQGTSAIPVSGTASVSGIQLSATTQNPSLTLELTNFGPTRLQGDFSGTLQGAAVVGTVQLDRVPAWDLQAESFVGLPNAAVLAMAVHEDTLWLSTSGDDYLLVTRDGSIVDQVAVEVSPGTRWTSSVLAGGGGKLWGHIVVGQGAGPSISRVLPFRREGLLPGEFELRHLSSGLAHDGTHLWSLDRGGESLHRLTEAGAWVDSVVVGHPDLYQLAWAGTHFWSAGWHLPLLWKIAPGGEVIGVSRLPAFLDGAFPAGLALDGVHLYVARGDVGTTTIARLTLVVLVP